MERLTVKSAVYDGEKHNVVAGIVCGAEIKDIFYRLTEIENILGDDYDLDRLRVIVNQCMTMREEVSQRFALTKNISIDRLKALVEADRNGRCVILLHDDDVYTIRGDIVNGIIKANCRNACKHPDELKTDL